MLERSWKKVFESDLENIASELKETVKKPAVIILSGPVGAGKTTFTKKFVGGRADAMSSPTYSIINENGNVAHADFYRLEEPEEIIHLELSLYLENKDFFLVEWGKKYVRDISRHVSIDFSFYEMVIEINEANEDSNTVSSRNFLLHKLDV
ncbi:tRNA threonylcarbamoyl adenosine modification protein YjeE [Bacteriovorax sp. BSW11_IV]|uniref:tRNA (adenosine(37)-N6)-threonylcarbamoyltransferase complex ATPase subunit type 1 TsaE n=1 Tax=Bacteriovorax sp. BSW11_IV TaxID=1353529 RepID=UPI000389DFCC|nr:tRNA (adenosine(37)-N6)-threonylcarbamoyltransferase complex ATPase subunit type 1 TsaE [Bacteriovorax sp. BSW11_IV]EQC46396.1 tRNA threonylcarbamoyl adenosine modification protein YjeE [Bacteriovorax sp. BSW11_IV]